MIIDAIKQGVGTFTHPCFVYDLDGLDAHLQALMAAVANRPVKLWYAVKANPLSAVIQRISQAGMQFDVASSGELAQVMDQGVSSAHILNTGPAKSAEQIAHFLAQGVRIFVVESVNQLAILNAQGADYPGVQVLLRVQFHYPDAKDNVLGGARVTPFGLAPEDWAALSLSDYPHVDVMGLHAFQWGNMLDLGQLEAVWANVIQRLSLLAGQLGLSDYVLDLGGGLGIPYDFAEAPLSWDAVMALLDRLRGGSAAREIWLELGRYCVGPYGYYLNQVVDIKEVYGHRLAVLAGGVNHLLRPAITDQPFPVQLLRESRAEAEMFRLVGPLCTAMDCLGDLPLPADLAVGDWLCFQQCGAYGFTESMPYFLCHTLPGEMVYAGGELQSLRSPAGIQAWCK